MDSSNNQKTQGGEKEFCIQPIKDSDPKNTSSTAGILKAQPGPAIPKEMPEQEGTKQDREAKMETLNK